MDAPFSHVYDLSDLSEAGAEITLTPSAEQRGRLAEWAGVEAIEQFAAKVTLRRRAANRFDYDATLSVDLVQSCVVTLDAVHSHMDLAIARTLHLSKIPPAARIAEHELAPGADDGPEEIQDPHYDIAAPLLEEFVLAIDPYPRVAGAVFEPPADPEPRESPFAVLKPLKSRE